MRGCRIALLGPADPVVEVTIAPAGQPGMGLGGVGAVGSKNGIAAGSVDELGTGVGA